MVNGAAGSSKDDDGESGPFSGLRMELVRVSLIREGAFGVLLADGAPFALTLEHTIEGPKAEQLTAIPAGTWQCRRTYFHRGGYDTYEVLVPGHSRLLFHRGNVEDDSEGCILVGLRPGLLHGRPAVLDSADGFLKFMWYAGVRHSFDLVVRAA